MRTLIPGLLALAGAAALVPAARADVVICVPYVKVAVGPVIEVRAPFVHIVIPRRARAAGADATGLAPPARPAPAAVLPKPRSVPGRDDPPPVPKEEEVRDARVQSVAGARPAVTPARPMTPAQFANSIKPGGGTYEVVLEHPFTGAPVKVTLTLPPGTPRKVRVSRLRLQLDYGRKVITVRFFRNGTVQVRS
jgi:hypothetical protein